MTGDPAKSANMTKNICLAEKRAIEKHRRELAKERGEDLSFDSAAEDWMEHHSGEWRRQRQEIMLAKQREEMKRHKWIESEKAREDVGKQAYMDWIKNHAATWREWYDENEEEFLKKHRLV